MKYPTGDPACVVEVSMQKKQISISTLHRLSRFVLETRFRRSTKTSVHNFVFSHHRLRPHPLRFEDCIAIDALHAQEH